MAGCMNLKQLVSFPLDNNCSSHYHYEGRVTLNEEFLKLACSDFLSFASCKDSILREMKHLYEKEKYLVCPHTATAVAAVKGLKLPPTTVCLATAHPAKFEEALDLALSGHQLPPRPKQLDELFTLPTRSYILPNSLRDIELFIREKLKKTPKENFETQIHRHPPLVTVMVICVSVCLFLSVHLRNVV